VFGLVVAVLKELVHAGRRWRARLVDRTTVVRQVHRNTRAQCASVSKFLEAAPFSMRLTCACVSPSQCTPASARCVGAEGVVMNGCQPIRRGRVTMCCAARASRSWSSSRTTPVTTGGATSRALERSRLAAILPLWTPCRGQLRLVCPAVRVDRDRLLSRRRWLLRRLTTTSFATPLPRSTWVDSAAPIGLHPFHSRRLRPRRHLARSWSVTGGLNRHRSAASRTAAASKNLDTLAHWARVLRVPAELTVVRSTRPGAPSAAGREPTL